jgi:hypothetical protein
MYVYVMKQNVNNPQRHGEGEGAHVSQSPRAGLNRELASLERCAHLHGLYVESGQVRIAIRFWVVGEPALFMDEVGFVLCLIRLIVHTPLQCDTAGS